MHSSQPNAAAARDDLVSFYVEALQNSAYSGVYNATAPNPVRKAELCSSLGSVLGRPSWLPVPEFALQVSARVFVNPVKRVAFACGSAL